MFKKFTALFAVLITVSSIFAQEQSSGTKFGLIAGLNLGSITMARDYSSSDYSYKTDITYSTGNLIGFHVGAVADIKILEFLYFQPGLLFSLKGGEYEGKSKEYDSNGDLYESDSEKLTIAPYYIDLPLMLSLKGTLTNDLSLRAHVGPYIGIGLFGKMENEHKGVYRDDSYSYKYEVKNVFSPSEEEKEGIGFEGFNRFNAGIGFGVGIEFQDFYLGVNYNYGLTNALKGDRGYEYYERTLGITLGYNF